MSVARIHDKQKVRSFWQSRVEGHSELMDEEENRVKSSALARLREEWQHRLAHRNQNLQGFLEERMRKVEKVQQDIKNMNSP